MNCIERLVKAGIDRESASEAVKWYISQGDENKLENYISECENRYTKRTESFYA